MGAREFAFLSVLVLSQVTSCGPGTAATNNTPPCESVYAGRCDTTCLRDEMCGAGLYCLSGRCTADCAPGARSCRSGQLCSANGRCVADGDAGGNDAGTTPVPIDGGLPDACADISVQLARRQATLLLLIDQSGSMTEAFGNTTRWLAVRNTLIDPMRGVLRPLQGEIRFGLAMYTSHNGSSGGTCPLLRPPLAAALNNFDEIARALNAAMPDDDTPTAESVVAATQLLSTATPDEDPGSRAIVLATDGEPDTCADPDAQNNPTRQAAARMQSVAAVRAAFDRGIRTYVISVGADVSQAHLQDLANAGSGAMGARYYQATDPDALLSAFRTITANARSCVFRLNGRVDPNAAEQGVVRLDSQRLQYNGADGWRLRAPNELELVGAACERARTTGSVLTANFPCGVVTPG